MQRTHVSSSAISSVGYDGRSAVLEVVTKAENVVSKWGATFLSK